jgi:protease-4
MNRSLSRLEKNALWTALGALIMVCALIYLAINPFPDCNVAYIKLQGEVITYGSLGDGSSSSSDSDSTASEDVTQEIRDADTDSSIKAIVLEIDSPGGSPVGGEEIESTLKASPKPTVALIRDEGDSAAYMAATGANKIYANEFSDVGDIGITSSYTDQSQQDVTEGITYNQLSIGKYKDMFSPDKPLTDDERTLIMGELQTDYQKFVQIVAQNRHLSIDTTTTIANGSGLTAQTALDDGLIDKIGDLSDVQNYLNGVLHKKASICGM